MADNKQEIATKLPINIHSPFHHRTIESERVEYKAGWNPESVSTRFLPLLMIFIISTPVMW